MRVDEIPDLVDKYGTCIYGFCKRLTRNKEDAEDLYQSTFLKAVELCEKIDETKNPKGFLISISVKHWKNQLSKKARRQKLIPIEDNDYEQQVDRVADGELLEDEIQKRFINKELSRIIDMLPEKFKIPVLMHYTVEMSLNEIAEALKIPQGTVKSRLYKARCIIKEKLEVGFYEKI